MSGRRRVTTRNPRVATHGVTLAWAQAPDFPPAYPTHDGRDVTWSDYDVAPYITHIAYSCRVCGYDGQPWLAIGTIHPLLGETFPVTVTRRTKGSRTPYDKTVDAAAWPVLRLLAHQCPDCCTVEVYDSKTETVLRLGAADQQPLF